MNFADLVRTTREKTYKSARDFHGKAGLDCTYMHYTSVENGKGRPEIELALAIVRKLGIPERQGILAWAASRMPDAASASVFLEVTASPGQSEYNDFSRSPGTVLSGAQVKYLVGDGPHADIIRYLMAHFDSDGVSGRELAKTFGIEHRRMVKLLDGLEDQGFVERAGDDVYKARAKFNLPPSAEGQAVRHAMFERAAKIAASRTPGDGYRAVLTRRLSKAQFSDLRSRFADLFATLDALPTPPPDDDDTYAIGVFAFDQPWRSS